MNITEGFAVAIDVFMVSFAALYFSIAVLLFVQQLKRTRFSCSMLSSSIEVFIIAFLCLLWLLVAIIGAFYFLKKRA